MFKRNSGFTLIELIVVIAVLGILAAIIIPNISNFQTKAKETQLTADARNMQTAVDMFRVDSSTGSGEPVANLYVKTSDAADAKVINLLDMTKMSDYLRKAPAYVTNADLVANTGLAAATTADKAVDLATLKDAGGKVIADFTNWKVAAGVGVKAVVDGANTVYKSTSIVQFAGVGADGKTTIVR